MLYYIRLQYRTVDVNRHKTPVMSWTRIQVKRIAKKATANIVRFKVNQTLWEKALKHLAKA